LVFAVLQLVVKIESLVFLGFAAAASGYPDFPFNVRLFDNFGGKLHRGASLESNLFDESCIEQVFFNEFRTLLPVNLTSVQSSSRTRPYIPTLGNVRGSRPVKQISLTDRKDGVPIDTCVAFCDASLDLYGPDILVSVQLHRGRNFL
jgi:hypothetical protein